MFLAAPDDQRARDALERGWRMPSIQGHGPCLTCGTDGWLFDRLCGVCREMAEWARVNRAINDCLYRDVPGRACLDPHDSFPAAPRPA
jgi:hypothetical protein